jgi:hypothetical protein
VEIGVGVGIEYPHDFQNKFYYLYQEWDSCSKLEYELGLEWERKLE